MASGWIVLIVPLGLTAALVGIALYNRSASVSSRSRPVRSTPRSRRYVAPWVLTVLRPLFTYNQHRDAYILRGVGRRTGPVLRNRAEGREPSGRFSRDEQHAEPELLEKP